MKDHADLILSHQQLHELLLCIRDSNRSEPITQHTKGYIKAAYERARPRQMNLTSDANYYPRGGSY